MGSNTSKKSKSVKQAAALSGKKQRRVNVGRSRFPMIVAAVVVAGLSLVTYARQSRPEASAFSPSVEDHWHHAYGFYLCDTWFQLSGDLEEADTSGFVNTDFARTGIHSHNDGVIHWHAASSAAVGERAKLGLFLDLYNVEVTPDGISFDETQTDALRAEGIEVGDTNTATFTSGETTCDIDGEERPGDVVVTVWESPEDTSDGVTYIADFDNIRLNDDSQVITIGFVPAGTELQQPPWAVDLDELAAVDNPLAPAETSGTSPELATPDNVVTTSEP